MKIKKPKRIMSLFLAALMCVTSLVGIKDEAFISLMWKFLRAGYMEQWTYHETYSGSPQGSGVSPILANIYLNELDEFMARMKKSFDKGDTRSRKVHKDHDKVRWAYRKAQKNLEIERTGMEAGRFWMMKERI